jgi:vitamin B12 transporter
MKYRVRSLRLATLPLALTAVIPLPSLGQTQVVLQETVVTATRVATPLSELVADVTVLDRDTLERSGATGLADVLSRVPGIELARNGGPGTTTGVFIRGAETRFTAVYIDGVRVDSQSTGGAPWEAIPLAQIERIEVLRGPASAIYGSDAMGGVVQIFTRKGEGAFAPYIGLGLGTYGTAKAEGGFSGAQDGLDYAFGLADERSSGFNARPVAGQNPDDDGYRRQSGSARLGLQLDKSQRLEVAMLSSDMNAQYDSATANDDLSLHRLQSAGLNWQARWSDAYHTRLSVTDSRSRYETTPSPYLTLTHLRGYLLQNEYRLGAQLFTAALERREDQLENASTTPAHSARSQNGVALGYGWASAPHSVQVHARQDQDSEFGAQTTGSAAYGYALTPQWRVTASAGTAFRAPTLYQRFSAYGVATLRPESSRNIEFGARYTAGSTSWGVVAYRNMVSNLIVFSAPGPCASAFGCYANVAQAEYLGLTLSGRQRLGDVNLHASLDVQDPRDQATGMMLARRANQHALLGVDTRQWGWTLGADAQLSGLRYDNAANTVVLPGYALLNLHAQTVVAKDWTALLRVDNASDAQYQLANTYATAGRSLYVGLKWAPQ